MLGKPLQQLAENIGQLEADLPEILQQLLVAVAERAVTAYIIPHWPVSTGRSRDAWSVESTATGCQIVCRAQYSSYVFAGGDLERLPIYPDLLRNALNRAANDIGIAAVVEDLTAAYVGQGRTTAHLTGVHRKFMIHTPRNQADAWRENHPGLIERIEVFWGGTLVEMEIVPSDTVAAGQMGSFEVGARRRGGYGG